MIITNTQRQNEDNEKRISTTDTQSLIEDLEPGVEYQFNVRAIGSENRESAPHPEFRDATCECNDKLDCTHLKFAFSIC